jgi:hemerythrin-like domain-containing protein
MESVPVQEVVVVHRVFRREFRLAAELVRAATPGDLQRAARLSQHVTFLLDTLHHHHGGEDDLLWPRLLERSEPDAELINRMQRQHDDIGEAIVTIEKRIPQWTIDANENSRDQLADAIERMHAVLVIHLDDEERHILPLAARHLTVAEWDQIGERGLAGTPKNKRMIMLGAILEDARPDETRTFLTKLPAIARLAYQVMGRRQHARWVADLRGGPFRGARRP